jgi:hypothetical protein
VSPADSTPLRVAVVAHANAPDEIAHAAGALVDGLDQAGQHPALLRVAGIPVGEGLLERRGFTGPITQVPGALRVLLQGDFDAVHALTAPDAQAALLWRRFTHRPVVFGCVEVLSRATVADGRLRLRFLTAAAEGSDALIAHSADARDALARWLAIDAEAIDPGDGQGNAGVYRRLLAQT